jgi:hypothetical protein
MAGLVGIGAITQSPMNPKTGRESSGVVQNSFSHNDFLPKK